MGGLQKSWLDSANKDTRDLEIFKENGGLIPSYIVKEIERRQGPTRAILPKRRRSRCKIAQFFDSANSRELKCFFLYMQHRSPVKIALCKHGLRNNKCTDRLKIQWIVEMDILGIYSGRTWIYQRKRVWERELIIDESLNCGTLLIK